MASNSSRRGVPKLPSSEPSDRWTVAVRHLRRVDPHLREVIRRIGPCRLAPRADRFGTLVSSIIAQQISSRAADSIGRKLQEVAGSPHQPQHLLTLGEAPLRGAGLSATKARSILALGRAVIDGLIPLDEFDDSWDDAAITTSLTQVKGIGPWTAEMFLIFALNRPDILPATDLGVRSALRARHGLVELPGPRESHALSEPWRPFRTVAAWYIWRNVDTPVAAKRAQATRPQRQPPRKNRPGGGADTPRSRNRGDSPDPDQG